MIAMSYICRAAPAPLITRAGRSNTSAAAVLVVCAVRMRSLPRVLVVCCVVCLCCGTTIDGGALDQVHNHPAHTSMQAQE